MPARTPAADQERHAEPAPVTPASLSPGPARLDLSRSGLLALQRTAGNAAVGALLQRAPGTAAPPKADPIATLRKLLQDGDANGAIAHIGRLESGDAGKALGMGDLRSLAVKAFDDEEMAHAMYAMKGGTLHQKLNWMTAEGSSWKLVRPLLVDPGVPDWQKTELYQQNYLRRFFTSICDDDEMEEAVGLLGGTLEAQLNWMFVEGTSVAAVRRRIGAHSPDKRPAIYKYDYLRDFFADLVGDQGMAQMVDLIGGTLNDRLSWMAYEDTNYAAVADRIRLASDTDYKTVSPDTRRELQKDMSAKDWQRVEAMLDRGVLAAEEVDSSRKEPHWEKKSYTDPAATWYVETYDVESKYQLERTRTELRVRVRIEFTGITPTAAHKRLWRNGIDAVWKGAFHVENADGKKLPIVFDPVFGASSPHHKIELVPPVLDTASGKLVKGRADAGKWYAGPNANSVLPEDTTNGLSAAHEFGHLVGLTDEYQLAKADYERIVGPAPAAVEPPGGFTSHTIMGDKTGGAELRHMTAFVTWLNAHRLPGEKPYWAVAGP
jgi:hypothetical protein